MDTLIKKYGVKNKPLCPEQSFGPEIWFGPGVTLDFPDFRKQLSLHQPRVQYVQNKHCSSCLHFSWQSSAVATPGDVPISFPM